VVQLSAERCCGRSSPATFADCLEKSFDSQRHRMPSRVPRRKRMTRDNAVKMRTPSRWWCQSHVGTIRCVMDVGKTLTATSGDGGRRRHGVSGCGWMEQVDS
jgi:hypothetical protein